MIPHYIMKHGILDNSYYRLRTEMKEFKFCANMHKQFLKLITVLHDDLGLRHMNGLKIQSFNPTVIDFEIRTLHDRYNCWRAYTCIMIPLLTWCNTNTCILISVQLHSWWVDANAYTETTRPLYAKATGFPLSLYVTKKMQTSAWNAVYQPLQRLDATEQEIDKLVCLVSMQMKYGS